MQPQTSSAPRTGPEACELEEIESHTLKLFEMMAAQVKNQVAMEEIISQVKKK